MGENWLGVTYVHEREWRLAPAGLDLYSGVAGIAFFLAYLGELTGSEQYTRLSRSALVNVREQLQQRQPLVQAPGGYSGWGSIFYLYAHLGVLWQDEELFEEAAACAQRVPDLLAQDHAFDLIGGAAGTILCLLALYRAHPHAQVLAAALRCGEWLLAHAAQCQTDQPQAETAAGVPHERFGVSWCHGAPGIGLGRLASLPYLDDDPVLYREIASALRTTLLEGFGSNHCLCHGDLGNLETVLTAAQVLQDAGYQAEVARLSAMILQSIETYGWQTGAPLSVETPSLLTGIAGIGYELLRLARPERVPNLLILEEPPAWRRPPSSVPERFAVEMERFS